MARHIRNTGLEFRSARLKLKPGKIHRCDLGGRLSLSYRKGKGAGKWGLRVYLGGERYKTEGIGESDDFADANGVSVFSFAQAEDRARERMKALDREAHIKSLGPVVTVRDAIETYIDDRLNRETPQNSRKLVRHVLIADRKLAETPLAALTAEDLTKWRKRLTETANPAKMAEGSARRVTNDFRAALNSAARRLRAELPPTFRDTVRDGLAAPHGVSAASEREPQVLPDADVRRLVDAAWEIDNEQGWGGDLGRMVLVLAATGARLSQIQRLRVVDLQVEQGRLMAPSSRKGTGSKASHIPVPIGPDVVDILQRATVGRLGTETLLLRPRWRRVPGAPGQGGLGRLEIYQRGPWRTASELARVWKAVVGRADLPKAIPYAFRHSSIVRGLRAGLPTRLVAALHDTSSLMIEKHYAKYISDALSELSRRAVVPLMSTVTPFPPLHAVEGGRP